MARLVAGYYFSIAEDFPMLRLALRKDGVKVVHTIKSPVRPRFYLPRSILSRYINTVHSYCRSPAIKSMPHWKFAHPDHRHEKPVMIEVWNPKNVANIRDDIQYIGRRDEVLPYVGEADIPYVRNVLRILKLGKNVDIVGGELVASDDFPDPRVLFVDVECSDKNGPPDPNRDPVTSIQTCTLDGEIRVFSWHPNDPDTSERKVFIEFLSYVSDFDHLIGWCVDFDRGYLIKRSRFLGFEFDWNLFRWIDLEYLYRKMHRLPWTVSLEFAVKREKYEEKKGYSIKKIKKYHELWVNDYNQFIERVSKHVRAIRDLEDDYLLYRGRLKLSDLSGLWVDRATWPSTVIRNLLLRNPYSGGSEWIFGIRDYSKTGSREKYEGAWVIEPSGEAFYTNLALIDFLSLYNKIIQTWNIGFDTLSEDGDIIAINNRYTSEFRSLPAKTLEWLEGLRDEYKKLRKKAADEGDEIKYEAYDSAQYATKVVLLTMYGVTGYKGSDIYIPHLAEDITLLGQDCLKYTTSEMDVLGYETLYGDTDSCIARFVDGEDDFIGTLETSTKFVDYLNGLYRDEFLPRYNIPDEWKKIEMKLEEIMYSVLFVEARSGRSRMAKKHYAYLKIWDVDHGFLDEPTLKVKGMETVRNEWCGLAKTMLEKVLMMRLKKTPKEEIYDYVNDTKDRFYAGEFDDLLVLSTGLGQAIEAYRSPGPHVRAAIKLRDMGFPVNINDKIDYVFTEHLKGAKFEVEPIIEDDPIPEISERAYEHYWDRRVFPPIESVIKGAMPNWQFETLKAVKRKRSLDKLFR